MGLFPGGPIQREACKEQLPLAQVDVVHELDGETRKLIRKSGIKVFISFRGKLARHPP